MTKCCIQLNAVMIALRTRAALSEAATCRVWSEQIVIPNLVVHPKKYSLDCGKSHQQTGCAFDAMMRHAYDSPVCILPCMLGLGGTCLLAYLL